MPYVNSHKVAIQTKYIPATNYKPSRVKAYTSEHSITVSFNSSDDFDEFSPYARAAQALLDKMGWEGNLIGGGTKNGEVFVFLPKHNSIDAKFIYTGEII